MTAGLKELKRRLAEVEVELKKAREAGRDDVPQPVYVMPQERLRVFSGKSDGSTKLTDFCEDVKAAIKLKKLKGAEAADFILAHLEGPARQEMKHHPSIIANDPSSILQTLTDTFGDKHTLGSVLRDICNRV